MLEGKQGGKQDLSILLLTSLGGGILGGLSIGIGLYYFLFNLILVGLFQVFIGVVALLIFIVVKKRLKIEERPEEDQTEDDEEVTHSIVEVEESSGSTEGVSGITSTKKSKWAFWRRRSKKAVDPIKSYQRYIQVFYPILLLLTALFGLGSLGFINYMYLQTSFTGNLVILIGVALVGLAFPYLLGANWFASLTESDFAEGKMFSLFLRGGQWFSLLAGISLVLKGLGLHKIDHYLFYFITVFIAVILLEVAIVTLTRLFLGRKVEEGKYRLLILTAFLSGSNPVTSLVDSLEEETGISLRSLWAIGFVRRSLPGVILVMMILLWGMTAFVQVQPDEKGILYHFGRIQKEPLLPGIHLKMPWPIETVRTVPAYKVHTFTVGYETDNQRNYLWTQNHGGEEYKLLLGDGKELVSINMLVSYQIKDTFQYVTKYLNPEEKLKGDAYRILFQEIVEKNLDQLLSQDRTSFAMGIGEKLQKVSEEQELGLEVINVALTNIHPPIELGLFYQDLVSAQIQKKILITKAMVDTEYQLPLAEKERDTLMNQAQIQSTTRWAEGNSEVIQYLYQQDAYLKAPDNYTQWKWLEAVEKVLANKRIYLLDEEQEMEESEVWLDMRTSTGKGE